MRQRAYFAAHIVLHAMIRLVLAVLLPAPLASAQPADPWPLVPGNSWTYDVGNTTIYTQGGGTTQGNQTTTWTVLDSVETAIGRLPRLQIGSGECLVETRRTGVRIDVQLLSVTGDAPCGTRAVPTVDSSPNFFVYSTPGAATSIEIGGQAVGVDSVRFGLGDNGGISIRREVTWSTADGIGVTGFTESFHATGTANSWVSGKLRYAAVGGRTYGTPVAGEDAPASSEALALSVGPNPARAQATLAFSLPAAAEARIEILDALGRTVQRLDLGARSAGAQSARLDVSGLAAGVYSVRLVAGDVQTAVRVSVVR